MPVDEMSLEVRRLLNPAFVGYLIVRAAQGFRKESTSGLPFLYAFLIPPLVLHSETRERLPLSVATKLLTWAERNGDLVTALGHRFSQLAEASREGLFAVIASGAATLNDDSSIDPAASKAFLNFEKITSSSEIAECGRKANFVGRWLSGAGTMPTVFTALGFTI